MPVRSLDSSVLKWPDRDTVDVAVRRWAQRAARDRTDLVRVGYVGSYARGDWGVGSDLDLVILVQDAPLAFQRRALAWDATELPVPADVLVYTEAEWRALEEEGRLLTREVAWVLGPHA